MYLSSIILMGAAPGGGIGGILPILLIFVVMYFFMIRPQSKKAKDEKAYKESLKKGDKVVTIGGIHGKIVDVQDTTLTLEIATNVNVKCERSAVSMEASKVLNIAEV